MVVAKESLAFAQREYEAVKRYREGTTVETRPGTKGGLAIEAAFLDDTLPNLVSSNRFYC